MNFFAKGGECESGSACTAALGAPSSLSQGSMFQGLTTNFHGGKRTRRAHRRAHRRAYRKHRMSGGSMDTELASYPSAFESTLPAEMRGAADISSLDNAFAELPKFQSGGKRTRRYRGGSLAPAPVEQPSMLLGPGEEVKAYLNPQWYTENVVNPNFKGPENALTQKGGKSRKASRKSRKASRKSRKASRKSRKSRKASRKDRKSRKASRKVSRKTNRKH
jgi:hypothetical protein